MTKTIHPLMSHYSSIKRERGREGGACFKFRPIGGALIRRGRLFEGGGGGANSKIYRGFFFVLEILMFFYYTN